ncbi:hypothetical protein V8E54_011264 [Elaphomyces granulatus]
MILALAVVGHDWKVYYSYTTDDGDRILHGPDILEVRVNSECLRLSLVDRFGGAIYAVSLLEIATQETSLNGDRRIIWPRSVGDKQLPILDGVLVLYDLTSPNSVLESSNKYLGNGSNSEDKVGSGIYLSDKELKEYESWTWAPQDKDVKQLKLLLRK